MVKVRKPKRAVLRGTGASSGIALGTACHLASHDFVVPAERVAPGEEAREIRRFRRSLREAREEVRALRVRLGRPPEDPADQILASHQLLLQDRELVREVVASIKAERMNAAYAVRTVLTAKARYLESLPSELFRGRAADIRDVERRVLGRLLAEEPSAVGHMSPGSIVVADELGPADTIALDPERTIAFVTEHGTLASHVTIVARSRGVPAVLGVPNVLGEIPDGAELIVDGDRGEVIISPNKNDRARVEQSAQRQARITALAGDARVSSVTADGISIPVRANIDRPEGAAAAVRMGAEGIGLYRTEFFFMQATSFPGEEKQRRAYASVLKSFPKHPVTIRTTDLGGDKFSTLMGVPRENNAFLGLRGIRFCLMHPEVFKIQIRALLRASGRTPPRILLPMIGNLEELRKARKLIGECLTELRAERHDLAEEPAVGVMIEVPSAVLISEALAAEADFFSIGSNDLIQYVLAVDRGNERVSHLYDGFDPAVLRAIDGAIWGAKQHEIPVGSCGEMSGDLIGAMLLVGLGVDELSVVPPLIPQIKAMLHYVRHADMQALAKACLMAGCAAEVRGLIREALSNDPQLELEERSGRLVGRWRNGGAQKGGGD